MYYFIIEITSTWPRVLIKIAHSQRHTRRITSQARCPQNGIG